MAFIDDSSALPEFADAMWPRVVAAGLDPYRYEAVTRHLTDLRSWPLAFVNAATRDVARARTAVQRGREVSAAEALRDAALLFHFATTLPNPDLETHSRAAQAGARAARESRAVLEPDAVELSGFGYTGVLRMPRTLSRAPVVLVIPGMNSGQIEFTAVARSLVARGMAAVTLDGPGQGELAPSMSWDPDYHLTVARLLDDLDARNDVDLALDRTGVLALSMGGFYGGLVAQHDLRARALAMISGPSAIHFDDVPPLVRDTFVLRTGSERAARKFADRVDVTDRAPRIDLPVLVVEGSEDVTPGVTSGRVLASLAPDATFSSIPGGNHLIENARWDWLPDVSDWMAERLAAPARRSGRWL